MPWIYLAAAISAEVLGTVGLRAIADSPSRWAAVLIAVSYGCSFLALAVALRVLNVGVVYAIWSAFGTAATCAAGAMFFGEHLNLQALLGLVLIVGGVTVLVTSRTIAHG